MGKKPLSQELLYWLYIIEGLNEKQVAKLTASKSLIVLEQACKAINLVQNQSCSPKVN